MCRRLGSRRQPVRMSKPTSLRCVIIAGPNGAGKTTFAREFLPKDTDVVHFVNADLIAAGLSALKPEIAPVTAGRVFSPRLIGWPLSERALRLKLRLADAPMPRAWQDGSWLDTGS